MNTHKLILIPEYRPLFGMSKCFGPPHGPLTKPCPTPVDIIGKLLLQTGKEALTIYEVVRDPKDPNVMLPPVQLTLDNYRLSYNEIAGIKEEPEKVTLTPPDEVVVVNPTEVEVSVPEVTESTAPVQVESNSEPEEVVPEVIMVKSEETPAEDVDTPDATESDDAVAEETPVDPYAGMTRAERKRARREAAAAQNAAKE